jgi:molybdenum cofactor cytidylyltransferase
MGVVGILLAAGHSRRFGAQNKLMQKLPDSRMLALASAQNLLAALPQSIAVVRSQHAELQSALTAVGMQLVVCGEHEQEMGDSLAAGIRHANKLYPQSSGFVIALGDMPYIQPQTIVEIANFIMAGRGIVMPSHQGMRGNPVGFAARFSADLLALNGDQGARILFERYPAEVERFECNDPGILLDIDTPKDLSGH